MDRRTLLIIVLVTGIVGLFLGFVFSLSFSDDSSVKNSKSLSLDEIQASQDLLKEYIDEQGYLQSRIVTLRSKIDATQKTIENHIKTANVEKLDELKKEMGITEIKGKGLEILIDDGKLNQKDTNKNLGDALVQASDIRDIVNILRASHAEGISVNNQRIISTSAISSVGTALLVNNSYIIPPIYIHAVGDQEMMLQRLLNKTLIPSIYDRRAKKNIIFQIITKNTVLIPVYNSDLKADYINLVK